MQEAFVKINNIPTKITTFGRWITEKPKQKGEKIILIIPGNPGITGFYRQFMKLLHEKNGCAVWGISYNGHEYYSRKTMDTKFPDPIGLRQQISQKISFIKEYVPEDAELHIIGHSIGSYMTLECLKDESINRRIFKTYLLFPTFERMAEAPNGKFLLRFIRPIVPVVLFLSWIFKVLPKMISICLLTAFMFLTSMPLSHRETIYNLINPKILQQVFFLAFQELEQVKERDDENIRNNLKKIHILYSEIDKWNLSDFYSDIKKDFPDISARTSRYTHAFIFHDNQDIADIVSKWISDSKSD